MMLGTTLQHRAKHGNGIAEAVVLCMRVMISWLRLFQQAAIVALQDELDDILRYGAAELFAGAVAADQQAQQAPPCTGKGAPPIFVCELYLPKA